LVLFTTPNIEKYIVSIRLKVRRLGAWQNDGEKLLKSDGSEKNWGGF